MKKPSVLKVRKIPDVITKTLALKDGDVLFVRIHDGEIRL
jgi:hypothetical protein